jgi:hypothetical protein
MLVEIDATGGLTLLEVVKPGLVAVAVLVGLGL